MRRGVGLVLVTLAVCALASPSAQATFPGANGKIAYVGSDGDWEIFIMNQDGSDPVQLTHNTRADTLPAFSPDGSKIAFVSERDDPDPDCFEGSCTTEIYVMNPDGTAQTRITATTAIEFDPTWTADGMRITFVRVTVCAPDGCDNHLRNIHLDGGSETFQGDAGPGAPSAPAWAPSGLKLIDISRDFGSSAGALFTGNPDGSGDAFFCCTPPTFDDPPPSGADWSPDASRVAFRFQQLSVQNADGTGFATLGPPSGRDPSWSPDGSKIAFWADLAAGTGIYTMDSDGSNVQLLRAGAFSPTWQPIPINAYPRPKVASPTEIALVPAYEPCTSPNRTHGPPLAFGSCNPPVRTPGELTVGTPDANGQGPRSTSEVHLRVVPGIPSTPADEADVRLQGIVNDVRLASDLSDYTGTLEARVSLRITDKDNTPHPGGPGAATTADIPYSLPIPCAATASTTIGAECSFETTAEAFAPGIAKEGRRAIWQLGQLAVHDGAGNVFMRQGIFVP